MTDSHRLSLSPTSAAVAVVFVLIVGAGATYLMMRTGGNVDEPRAAPPRPSAPAPLAALSSDVVIALTKEAVERAGILASPVSSRPVEGELRLPGIVEPHAYRKVTVTPLVSGRVVRVTAQLGDRVRKGQRLAEVYSPELAEARTKYVTAKAMLDAHDRELQRTEKLVAIGAASRQEFERVHAEHAAQTAEVESARSRLQLLGVAETSAGKSGREATIDVPAPIDGVVTERPANVGLNVEPATALFSIVDLSSVWIIADVYERDLNRVREGERATVTTRAYPDLRLEGRVSYIDPQLNAGTRTAKVRVEVANPKGELRLGMYADVSIAAGGGAALAVPRRALQNVGDRQVVYVTVPGDATKFVEREVRIGRTSGEVVEILSGLSPGDSVVSNGSFFVRAEAERVGLRARQTAASTPAAAVQAVTVSVTEKGYEPDRVTLRAGIPARLTFVRTTDNTCGTEIVFRSMNIKRALPLNEPVAIEFTPARSGEIAFACGMAMLSGIVVVQ